jgi:phage shock protein E
VRRFCCSLLLLLALPLAAADDAALWIDVRSPEEYAAGHLDGAINIPYDQIAIRIGGVAPDRQRDIRLYCRVGRRAQMAKFALEAQGYARVTNEGGFETLRAQLAAPAAGCSPNC